MSYTIISSTSTYGWFIWFTVLSPAPALRFGIYKIFNESSQNETWQTVLKLAWYFRNPRGQSEDSIVFSL